MRKNQQSKYFLKRLCAIPLAVLTFLFLNFAKINSDWTEKRYSQTIYPNFKKIIGFIPSKFSFSFFEFIILISVIMTIVSLAYFIYSLKSKRSSRQFIIYRFLTGIIAVVCSFYIIFTFTCGLNYYRYSFIHYLDYDKYEPTQADLEEMIIYYGSKLDVEKINLSNQLSYSFDKSAKESVIAMNELAKAYPILGEVDYFQPKALVSSKFFSKAGIAGLFFPFTYESNINVAIPNYMIPATMTHELAHQAGFMSEDEANFIAYLACVKSNDTQIRYSGYFFAFTQSIVRLKKIDSKKANDLESRLSDSVKTDLNLYRNYLKSQAGLIQTISLKMNNRYLKANNQSNGVKDYNQVVSLLLLDFHKNYARDPS